jgi:hypothetical protein
VKLTVNASDFKLKLSKAREESPRTPSVEGFAGCSFVDLDVYSGHPGFGGGVSLTPLEARAIAMELLRLSGVCDAQIEYTKEYK